MIPAKCLNCAAAFMTRPRPGRGLYCSRKCRGEATRNNNESKRAQARACGEKFYFTGLPCKNDHIAQRYVRDATCVECARASTLRWASENLDKRRQLSRINSKTYRLSHPERFIKKARSANELESTRARMKRYTDEISPCYVALLLEIPAGKLSLELYEAKREHLRMVRLLKEKKREIT